MRVTTALSTAIAIAAISLHANADIAAEQNPVTPPTTVAPASTLDPEKEHTASRAEFSGGRMVGEILVGLVAGGAAQYGTYKAMCGDEFCMGGYLAGVGAGIAGSTLGVYTTGAIFGGKGTIGWTIIGVLLPFSATAALAEKSPGAAIAVSLALGPLIGALAYEARSNMEARNIRAGIASIQPTVKVLANQGAVIGVAGLF